MSIKLEELTSIQSKSELKVHEVLISESCSVGVLCKQGDVGVESSKKDVDAKDFGCSKNGKRFDRQELEEMKC